MRKRLLSLLLAFMMVITLLPTMSMTVDAATYNGFIFDDLQPNDILKPGARKTMENDINIVLQSGSWCTFNEEETYTQGIEEITYGINSGMTYVVSEYSESLGAIFDTDGNMYLPYFNGAKANAWKVVSVAENTITLAGYACVESVTLDKDSASLTVGDDPVALTATVSPDGAADKTVKWSVNNSTRVKLYSDADCKTEVGTAATDTLTVYAKGFTEGRAIVTVRSNENNDKASTCAVTVAKADPTAPTGLTATYGQTLANVTLTTGWTWADDTQSVGSVGSNTFKANFAGDDNYNAASNVDVTVTVSKANATTAMQAASVSIAGTSGKTATVSYTLPDGASYGAVTNSNTEFFTVDTTSGIVLTAAKNWTASDWATDTSKNFTVRVSDATNYNDYTLTVTVTPTYKATQTITAADVTATYGDTNAKIEATTTSGGGTLSYTVKSGDAVTVDASGNLTINKAGSAVITVTAAETDTYAQATKDVNVTVNTKAMTVSAENVNMTVDGQPHGITVNVTDPASGATVKYGTEVGTYNLDASPTQTEAGELTVYYQVTADNYTTYTGNAKVTINAKQTQTITAADVTATFGDTGKKVEATTNGNGAISYAVKDGSADYIDVDASTGALTIKKVGTATVIVTAAETDTYAQAAKEVTVTINKANAVAATVTANNRTYDGTEKPLVAVSGTPTGGTMQYALGTATEATEQYTPSIPTATNAGTYFVWYKAVGDTSHSDSDAKCIEVTINVKPVPPKKPQTVGKTTIRNTIANSAKKTNDVVYDAVSGATGYDIAYKHKNSGKWVIKSTGKQTRATIGGLSIGGMYQIKVRAKKAETAEYKAATGAWSPVVYRYFHTTQKIRLASKAKKSFTMSWSRNAKATGYQVMFSTNKNGAGAAKNINTVGKNATSLTKTGLKSGVTYYVQVKELVKIGNVNYIGNISKPVAVKIK